MNHRLRTCLTLLILIIACGATFATYARQQTAEDAPGSISGHLTNGQKPLSHIKVRAWGPKEPRNGQQTRNSEIVTDETGYYRFADVVPGSYQLVLESNDYITVDEKDFQTGRLVRVMPGADVVNIDFDTLMTGKIRGRIVDASGNPLVEQFVHLTVVAGNKNQVTSNARSPVSIRSDAQGYYNLDRVVPGRYVLSIGGRDKYNSIMMSNSHEKDTPYGETFYPGTAEIAEAIVVEVTPGASLTGIDIVARHPIKTFQITGRLVNEKTGAPVPKVPLTIDFRDRADSPSNTSIIQSPSDSRGRFRMPTILPGHVSIRAASSAATNTYSDRTDVGQISKNVTGLNIKMHRGSTLNGQLIFDDGSGKTDVERISKIKLTAAVFMTDDESVIISEAIIEPDGRFRFAGLPPGIVHLRVQSKITDGPEKLSILKVEHDGKEMTNQVAIEKVKNVTGLQIVVHESRGSGSVRGQVKIDGVSVDGDRVEMYVSYRRIELQSNGSHTGRLDNLGRFVIENMPPGDYEFGIGPSNLIPANEAQSKIRQRMPIAKQIVKVTAGAESEVILTIKLNPQ